MNTHTALAFTVCLTAATLSGCSKSPAPTPAVSTTKVALPASLFTNEAPGEARKLIDAKKDAKAGDHVVFEARVGGSRDPFVKNRAVFLVADPSLLSCDQNKGDGCKTPWDYCCEAPDHLKKHMATIQVVDAAGQPLKVSIENEHGLESLKTIVVAGTVDQIDDAGLFIVNAESIHVRSSG